MPKRKLQELTNTFCTIKKDYLAINSDSNAHAETQSKKIKISDELSSITKLSSFAEVTRGLEILSEALEFDTFLQNAEEFLLHAPCLDLPVNFITELVQTYTSNEKIAPSDMPCQALSLTILADMAEVPDLDS